MNSSLQDIGSGICFEMVLETDRIKIPSKTKIRFPDQKDSIILRFRKNINFQTLCDDYKKCAEAVEHWNQSELTEAPARRKEYSNLLPDLEEEIRQYLNGSN